MGKIKTIDMDKPKKLILDYSKWRCGEDGEYKIGIGKTKLQNEQGYCCCLGLWSLQLGAKECEIIGCNEPNELETLIPIFASIDEDSSFGKNTSELSWDCITINDDPSTTPDDKIKLLTERLAKEGIELEVINKP